MSKKIPVIIGLIFAAIAIFFLLYWSRAYFTNSSVIIRSSDGIAELSLSKKALPDGVSLSEVAITKEEIENFFDASEGNPKKTVTAYKLSPDGLELKEPATITITAPRSQDAKGVFSVPLLLHKSKSGIEVIQETTVDMQSQDTMSISGRIQHFSWVLHSYERYPIFYIELKPYTVNLPIGESALVKISITQKVRTHPRETEGANLVNVAPNTTWRVNMDGEEHTVRAVGSQFEPNRIVLPPREMRQSELVYSAEKRLTCKKKGQTTLIGWGGFTIEYSAEMRDPYFERNADGILVAPEPVLMPARKVNVNDIFQSYLYSCDEPGVESVPSITTPTVNVEICGLPGGKPCPKR